MELVKIALVISTLSSLNYMKEAVCFSSDVHPHICFSHCVEKFSNGSPTIVQRIYQLSAPNQLLKIERLVVVLYRVNNGRIQIFIPNVQRQQLFPDLHTEETDVFQPDSSKFLNDLFSRSPHLVVKPIVSGQYYVSQKYNTSIRNLVSQQRYSVDKQQLFPDENYQTIQNEDSNLYFNSPSNLRTSPSKVSRYISAVDTTLGNTKVPTNYFSHFHSNKKVFPNQSSSESNEASSANTISESNSMEYTPPPYPPPVPDYLLTPQRQSFNSPIQTPADLNSQRYWNNGFNTNMQQGNFMYRMHDKTILPHPRRPQSHNDPQLYDTLAQIRGQKSYADLLPLQQSQNNLYPQRPPWINYNVGPQQFTLNSGDMCANNDPPVNDKAVFSDWFVRQVWQLGPSTISNLPALKQNTKKLLRENRLLMTRGCVIDGNHQAYPIKQLVLRRLLINEKPSNSVFKHQWYLLTLGSPPSLIGLIPTDPDMSQDPEEKENLIKLLSGKDLTHDENEPEYRIVGGDKAIISGHPVNNKGRSGIIA